MRYRRTILSLALPALVEIGVAIMPNIIDIQREIWISLLIIIGIAIAVLPAWSEWATLKRIRLRTPITLTEDVSRMHTDKGQGGHSSGYNKLQLVVRAIAERAQNTRKGHEITVYITDANGLSGMYPDELKEILLKLQEDHKAIMLKTFPDWLLVSDRLTKRQVLREITSIFEPANNCFTVSIQKGFARLSKQLYL